MNKNELEITIKIEGKEWEDAIDKAFVEANKTAKIDGFRPGKAPKAVFMKKYGKESLFFDAADLVLDDAYHKMIEENKDIEIVAQPSVALKSIDEKYVEFVFTLTKKPDVKLGKYKKLGIKKEEVKVTKEEIDHALEETLNRYSENITKDGSVENGDVAIIDFEGFKDGVAFEGGKGENYSLTIGSNTFIPGFEEQLIGVKAGETKEINVTFPENYHSDDLKGLEATFKVKVNEVKTIKVPELNKDFFDDLGMEGIDSEETLRKQLEENIHAHKELHAENDFIDALLVKAIENMEVDVPDVMVDDEINRMLKQYEENLKMQGITLEQFYQFTNSDEEALKNQMKEEALKIVKERLLLEEIAKEEKIEVNDEDAEKEADVLATQYQMKKDEFLNLFGGIEMVKYDLKMRKALEVIKDNN
jgi:trigger factor